MNGSLRNGPKISVRHKTSETDEITILFDTFPKEVAITFSGLIRKKFPPLNQVSTADLLKPKSNSILLERGHPGAIKEVLEWMLSCCTGSGLHDFKGIPTQPYWKLACAYEAAQYFEMPYLQEKIWGRLDAISRQQIHSADVRIICSRYVGIHQLSLSYR